MRRKIIQHYADVLCHMGVGWRMGDDLETLAMLPDGTIRIDVLAGSCVHSVAGELDLRVAREMQTWLKERFTADHIPEQQILGAELSLTFTTTRIRTNQKRVVSFDWSCASHISTDEKAYESRLSEAHTWHKRIEDVQEI